MTIVKSALAVLLTVTVSLPLAEAANLSGALHDPSGRPLAGVMISAKNLRLRKTVTVFSDIHGAYRIEGLEDGVYDLRARRIGYADEEQNAVTLAAAPRRDFTMRPLDWEQAMYQLPASAWFAKARFPSVEARAEFTIQCAMCHQVGSTPTRLSRTHDEWNQTFDKMAQMGAMPTKRIRREIPDALNMAFRVTAAADVPPLPAPVTGEAAQYVITEWDVGEQTSDLHDIVVGRNERIYAVDWILDKLFMLDPTDSSQAQWPVPAGDSKPGGILGRFATRGATYMHHVPSVAPHSIQPAEDGKLWITLSLGKGIASFDPATRQFRTFDQPSSALYPHTVRFDAQGRLWYTLAMSNHIARFDPATEEFELYRLPTRSWTQAVFVRLLPVLLWITDFFNLTKLPDATDPEALPIAYGIDVAPDGMIWFSQFNHRRIGRLDPATGDVKLIDTPFYGPRRLRVDNDGILWIPSYTDSSVFRFDPGTEAFKRYPLPTGDGDLPYALNVDRKTGMVWICGTNSDTLIRFDPKTERFLVIPLPTQVTFTRELDFDASGNVWTSNSNIPGWHIEGQQPRIIRLSRQAH